MKFQMISTKPTKRKLVFQKTDDESVNIYIDKEDVTALGLKDDGVGQKISVTIVKVK